MTLLVYALSLRRSLAGAIPTFIDGIVASEVPMGR